MGFFNRVKPARFVWPLACLVAVTMLFISEGAYWQAVSALDKLGARGAVRADIMNLQHGILSAETGQRYYVLTGRSEDLQTYEQALKEIDDSFRSLDQHYGQEPKPREILGKLHTLTEARLSELALMIQQRKDRKAEAVSDIVPGDVGRGTADAARTLSAELLDYEAQNVEAGRTDLYRTLLLSRSGMAALSAISLLVLYMNLRQSRVLKRQQQELELECIVRVERDRLETEVIQRTAQLTELTHHLQTAREDERHRLARNLHDDLGALLTSAKLDAARIKSRLAGRAPEALELLAHLVNTLNSGIALGRRIIEDLRPSALRNLGLVSTLEILAREFGEQSGIEVHCALEPVALAAPAELMVYRLVQEAITNITKYARASHVWLTLGTRNGQVEVSVRDDGLGFDTTVSPRSAYGLVGMRFRVEAEGGTLTLQSAPGQGTVIQARLPESKVVAAQAPMHY